ncbi:MAG: TIGR00730 family Rossman fold protein [Rhodobacteraceae bacterium]|nr:TIGR00730 family Rossman fold protein [Paracoccaceae bacterium]
MNDEARTSPFRGAGEDAARTSALPESPQARSPAYRLAFADLDFLLREDLRPVRLQLELLKPELVMSERGIRSTVVFFGGSRVPAPEAATAARTPALAALAPWYEEARRFAFAITGRSLASRGTDWVVVTGGGPGVMEAGNRGADEAGGISVGLNIVLPHEQAPNPWVTPGLCFNFHYFAIRKMHFLMRARAIAIFPGGFGTFDELFESLTLIQTGRMRKIPFLLFGAAFWRRMVDWEGLEAAGMIDAGDLRLIRFVETAEEAIAAIDAWPDPGPEAPGIG